MPFKKVSTRLQSISRASIDSVYWFYESLFNKNDAVKKTFNLLEYVNQEWVQELHVAVEAFTTKPFTKPKEEALRL